MQAIILAAGMGKRLKYLTNGNTKCMVKVNGITMIERALTILDKKNLSKIVIVVGYEGQKLIDYVNSLHINTSIEFINNSIYDKTNNIYSLALAKDYLCSEDTLLLESDLVFEERVIDLLLEDERETLALVDKFESWMDGTCMELDDDDCIIDFIPGKHLKFSDKDKYYKTVNIYKFSKEFCENTYVPFLSAYEKTMGENEYYESVIKLIAMLEKKDIRAKRLNGQKWYEIDNIQDLDVAEVLFSNSDSDHLDKINERYGGFWRFPKLTDFCYLVNPYYPSEKLMEEIKSNFETLISQYPSGMKVNSLVAASNFGVRKEYIAIGNGAAELIKSLLENQIKGKIGCIYPTFEEYPNRYIQEKIVGYKPSTSDFRYNVDDLIDYYNRNQVDSIVLINPDNPSGNFITYTDLIRFIEWCKSKSIKLIIDESFVDFADLENGKSVDSVSLIKDDVLEYYSDLFVVKSISKSYGVPGIRLGIIVSSNTEAINKIKKDVSIWNINSFGEFYMQIMEKYNKDYALSLEKLRIARKNMMEGLRDVPYMKVFPSQANYVMCELEGISSRELCEKLLKHNILIKDLSNKIKNGKQYVRIAIRNKEDNDKLISCLKELKL